MVPPEKLGLRPFSSPHYQAHNKARLDHLASLGLPLKNRRVIELGSGPGDHTGFYLERSCSVTAVDARQVCLDTLRQRFPQVATLCADLNDPSAVATLGQFEIAHCYGILYHLERPECLLLALGQICTDLAIVETCVSPGDGMDVVPIDEMGEIFSQSVTNRGCRPSRRWVFKELARHFPWVYSTRTQPDHPEFPLDWASDFSGAALIRSIFVASRKQLRNSLLIDEVPTRQERCLR
jgi:SAM-dependent methyltransferase